MSFLVLGVPEWSCILHILHTNPFVFEQKNVLYGAGSVKIDLNFNDFDTPTPLVFEQKMSFLVLGAPKLTWILWIPYTNPFDFRTKNIFYGAGSVKMDLNFAIFTYQIILVFSI